MKIMTPLSLPYFVILLCCLCFAKVLGGYTPYAIQSFSFDYDLPSQPVRITVTEQCQTINITWGRRLEIGPNPVAPYFLQVFTSAFIVPFVIPAGSGQSFQWAVPFAPGTLYQICMSDLNGNSGGCQATYTMIATYNSTVPPTCQNVTFPPGALDVVGQVWNGPLSQYGWIDQCTDIAVTPRNGTPPYTFIIAPTLHPLFRITSNSMSNTMNWTVSLSWTTQFFISVADSAGNSWANGPLHSGRGTTSACLAIDSVTPKKPFPVVSVASSLSASFGGLLLGGLIAYLVLRSRAKTYHFRQSSGVGTPQGSTSFPRIGSGSSYQYQASPSISGRILDRPTPGNDLGLQHHIEPFMMPNSDSHTITDPRISTDVSSDPRGEPDLQAGSSSQPAPSTIQHPNQVYVVHHDGGGPPVTLYTSNETEIVELPPGYPGPARRHTRGSSSLGNEDRIERPPTSAPGRARTSSKA